MVQKQISAPKKYDKSMKETLEILQDKDVMEQLLESEENRKKGIKPKKLDI